MNTNKNLPNWLPAAICVLAVFPASPVLAQLPDRGTPRQQLKGHLTAAMANAPQAGRVPPTTQLTLTIGLVIGNRAAMMDAAAQIADPASPSYRQYLTPEQFADLFGASPADYQSVLDWAQANNLSVTPHRNRFVATVTGAVADIETALNIHLGYHLRPDGSQFFAPDAEPSVAFSVPVDHIGGLDNLYRPESARGSGAGGTYQGDDFRHAYAPGITLTGAGQRIGIFMADGFTQSDIDGYAAQVGHTYLPVQVVLGNGSVVSASDAALTPGGEGTLDVEAALSMAPAAQVIAFVGSHSQILANMADYPGIRQLSSSWFWPDGSTTDENHMAQFATQGQSFFQASGDSGAYPPEMFGSCPSGSAPNRTFNWITIVGGTDLHMSDNGADYGTLETAWPSSSGGMIKCHLLPAYQNSIAYQFSSSDYYKNAPDVSAQANGIDIFYQGMPQDFVGTSEATPLWAGFMALVNELMANYGLGSVGFANPALYALAGTSDYAANFHDIVTGDNFNSTGYGFWAGTGWDAVTGLGSPTNTLIYTLSGVPAYPLYCEGPLTTTANSTPFQWASQGASAALPLPGQCAWADRAPYATEIHSGGGNVIVGGIDQVANLSIGKFGEIGVYFDPATTDLIATQVVGLVKPPFSSKPLLP